MPLKRNKGNKTKLLSVIVPIYRQERTIEKDLKQIEAALKRISSDFDYEIIGVVDGMIDQSYSRAKKISSGKIKVYGYRSNRGKGYAVRYGMARAKGDPVAFIDSGMDINPQGIPLLLSQMEWYDSDVIVGSIRHSASKVVGYPPKRKLFSYGYHWFVGFLFGLNITDSQRGIKIFRRKVLEKVLPRLLVKKFAFDIEILAVARHLGFKKIHDGPVEMDARKMKYSSIRLTTIFTMLIDTLAVFYRLYLLDYYGDDSKRKWIYDKDLDMRVNV